MTFTSSYLFFRKKSTPITIDQEEVGYIRKTAANTLEKNRVFTYTSYDEEKYYVLGIKKNGWKHLVLTEYQLQTNSKKYHFKDKLGSNILYFCVMGGGRKSSNSDRGKLGWRFRNKV
ncbi:hypothetical protein CAI16_14165 [Virgibacillus dokdonensis]|uniref:Uncharacterized protein n=1 Tax=Virgibacillus dokdonensis TaxID=302167 RepID=A0A3E0WNR1_9BACI|nr:hypothetical protein [Virgibacillus dokdonensis]RFA33616.1 hypothetical protein CAI16_14165 [Virgibacillus dokdonensis]